MQYWAFTVFGLPILLAVWLAYRYLPTIGESKMPEALGAAGGLGTFVIFLSTTVDGDPSTFALIGALTVGASVLAYFAVGPSPLSGRDRCRIAASDCHEEGASPVTRSPF